MTFEQYVVIAEYIKKNKNDISLNAGDIVDVIEKNYFGEISRHSLSFLYLFLHGSRI